MLELIRRWAPMLVIIGLTVWMQWYVARKLRGRVVWTIAMLASFWMAVVVPLLLKDAFGFLSTDQLSYLMAASLSWVILTISAALWVRLRPSAELNPERRKFLMAAAPVVAAVPVLAAGAGAIVARSGMHTREVSLKIKGLHKDLDGLRIAQVTDIHYGPFFGRRDLERAIAMANECKPHLTVVTGDLITRHGDDWRSCMQILRGLKAEAGLFGCHGNHEDYAGILDESTVQGAKQGLRFLRGESATLRFGQGKLNMVGHDYQRFGSEPIRGADELMERGAFNMLLQHNPAVFPRAAQFGFDLMLAGHTHGGQINVEVADQNLNLARIFTPYVRGEYQRDGKLLYVSSGLGTVAIPIRLGAPPEVTVIRLCAV